MVRSLHISDLRLAQQLNVEKKEVEELLIGLILEGKVEGKIDQVAQRLEITRQRVFVSCYASPFLNYCISSQSLARRRYAALDKWTSALDNLNGAIAGKGAGNASDARGDFERLGAMGALMM